MLWLLLILFCIVFDNDQLFPAIILSIDIIGEVDILKNNQVRPKITLGIDF